MQSTYRLLHKPPFLSLFVAFLLGVVSCSATVCFGQEIVVSETKNSGVYAVGEKIIWHLQVQGEGASQVSKISYVLRKGSLTEMGRGDLTLTDGGADLETRLDEPGAVMAEFQASIPGKPTIKGLAGAIVAPDKIMPSSPRPADFDAFWQAKIEELAVVPATPVLEPGQSGNSQVDYWKISLNNIRGTKIRGQIARPKVLTKKLPALLLVQYAGVYPLKASNVIDYALEGWLTLNINAHDLPIDAPAEFYEEQKNGALKDYRSMGNDDREKSYFLRMYLSCYRAVDYLASRDDWDGKTIVVMGSSQGGLQSIMTAGLHPKVTALLANVPAGCDHTGPLVGRRAGWPQWMEKAEGKDAAKVLEASRYFDVVNFASHVRCPALVSFGLIDTTCPASGVAAAFNQISAPKELLVMEKADHQGQNHTQAVFYARAKEWLQSLKNETSPLAK